MCFFYCMLLDVNFSANISHHGESSHVICGKAMGIAQIMATVDRPVVRVTDWTYHQ
uniref:Uncharacterized protein n=1 Tax=Anguilla anguilla TaxID=7936 RepID=A0A0E9R517_ANGAN